MDEDGMLRQVWNNYIREYGYEGLSDYESSFVIDETVPSLIVDAVHLTTAEKQAVLEFWFRRMLVAIDAVSMRYKEKAQQSQAKVTL
jgi:hypothetical protein